MIRFSSEVFVLSAMVLLTLLHGPARAADLEVTDESVRDGPLRARLAQDGADLVLLYGAEQEGRLGTCGCPTRPRGGLDRVDRYASALRKLEEPVVLLNAGGYLDAVPGLDGRLRPDALVRGRYLLEGLELGGWDVANLGYRDLPYQGVAGLSPLAVSANLEAPEGEGPPSHRIVEVDGVKVAVTGVSSSALLHMQPDGWTFGDPVAALEALVPTLQADVVVVLAYEVDDPRALARIDGVDVLIEASSFHTSFPPLLEEGAVWVRARHGTQQLGELRLTVRDGVVVAAHDRKIDLDEAIVGTPPMRRLARRADREIGKALEALLE